VLDDSKLSKWHMVMWSFFLFPLAGCSSWSQLLILLIHSSPSWLSQKEIERLSFYSKFCQWQVCWFILVVTWICTDGCNYSYDHQHKSDVKYKSDVNNFLTNSQCLISEPMLNSFTFASSNYLTLTWTIPPLFPRLLASCPELWRWDSVEILSYVLPVPDPQDPRQRPTSSHKSLFLADLRGWQQRFGGFRSRDIDPRGIDT